MSILSFIASRLALEIPSGRKAVHASRPKRIFPNELYNVSPGWGTVAHEVLSTDWIVSRSMTV